MIHPFFDPKKRNWHNQSRINNESYICGYCNDKISSDRGYKLGENQDGSGPQIGGIYICPNCQGPTFIFGKNIKFPSHSIGERINYLPENIHNLYEEARRCTTQNSFTATVMLCRKILMNIAVDNNAKENLNFLEYINYLSDKGYIPPNGKHWVDHIRKKGNEANHEIKIMTEDDASKLLLFTGMLLKFIYEFPKLINEESSIAEDIKE